MFLLPTLAIFLFFSPINPHRARTPPRQLAYHPRHDGIVLARSSAPGTRYGLHASIASVLYSQLLAWAIVFKPNIMSMCLPVVMHAINIPSISPFQIRSMRLRKNTTKKYQVSAYDIVGTVKGSAVFLALVHRP